MTDSDTPADRDDGTGASRRPTDGSPGRSGADESDVGDPHHTETSDARAVPRVADEAADSEVDGSDAAAPPAPEPIEPETPRPENAVFVLLGVLGTVALLATVIVPGAL